ncbi:Predicted arabinose efflux permease, MFS family [Shimia sagamensis]|uniref:Predicted arabinose efflux permease, MFS family n=2 Tax=Shimia sagamensis TaxID=1566352 RepID=A0ABY1PMF5_9RHOB|nr:Predicted arabinose efflux permease, MFS family [Shimia sagamensis]
MPNVGAKMSSFRAQVSTLKFLFLAVAAIQLVTAASGTIVALYFAGTGASQEIAALAPAAYSLGFLIGCFFIAGWITSIGHIRAFSAAAAICTASALLFSVTDNEPTLLFVRFLTGIATAGLFAIGDAWISETVDGSSRGRLLAVFAIILGLMSVLSQVIVIITPDDLNQSFVLVSLLYCLAIVVIAATPSTPPEGKERANVRVKALFADAPTAAFGAIAVGIVSTVFMNVVPYRAAVIGVDAVDVAIAMGAIYVGRILFLYPLGLMSDRMDRRRVILVASVIASFALLTFALLSTGDGVRHAVIVGTPVYRLVFVGLILLGGSMLTLYSLLLAHAMDRTVPVYVASSAVTMLFVFTIGGIIGPLLTSAVSAVFGDMAMGWMLMIVMAAFAVLTAVRIKTVAPAAKAEQTNFKAAETTSLKSAPTQKR